MTLVLDPVPRKPTTGERLSQGIGRGLEIGSQLYQQNRAAQEQQLKQQQMAEALQQLGLDPRIMNLPPEILKSHLMGQQQEASDVRRFQHETELAKQKQLFEQEKLGQKQFEEEESKNITQDAFNRMVSLIPDLGRGSGLMSMLGGTKAEKMGEFTSLTGALEALLVEKVNKGTLSDTRFKYITENLLPKPTDTQSEIKGKLLGLARMLGLDPSSLTGKKSMSGQVGLSQGEERPPLSSFRKKK